MGCHGFLWNSMEVHRIPWNSKMFYAIRWNPMEFHRLQWNSMEFFGIHLHLFYEFQLIRNPSESSQEASSSFSMNFQLNSNRKFNRILHRCEQSVWLHSGPTGPKARNDLVPMINLWLIYDKLNKYTQHRLGSLLLLLFYDFSKKIRNRNPLRSSQEASSSFSMNAELCSN